VCVCVVVVHAAARRWPVSFACVVCCWAWMSRCVWRQKGARCPWPSQSIPQKMARCSLALPSGPTSSQPVFGPHAPCSCGRCWALLGAHGLCSGRAWLQTHSLFLAAGPAKFLELLSQLIEDLRIRHHHHKPSTTTTILPRFNPCASDTKHPRRHYGRNWISHLLHGLRQPPACVQGH
jgi:hypothetical protein